MPFRPTSEAAVALEKQAASMRRPDHHPHGQSGPQLSKISPDLHRILIHFALGVWRPQKGKKNPYNFKMVKKAASLPCRIEYKKQEYAKYTYKVPTKYPIESHPITSKTSHLCPIQPSKWLPLSLLKPSESCRIC